MASTDRFVEPEETVVWQLGVGDWLLIEDPESNEAECLRLFKVTAKAVSDETVRLQVVPWPRTLQAPLNIEYPASEKVFVPRVSKQNGTLFMWFSNTPEKFRDVSHKMAIVVCGAKGLAKVWMPDPITQVVGRAKDPQGLELEFVVMQWGTRREHLAIKVYEDPGSRISLL